MFRPGRVILAQECFLIEAQIARNGAHKAVAKDAAGQFGPIFIFEGLDKTGADARSLGEFLHGNFAQFALALQAFTKISLGHEPKPILDDPSRADNFTCSRKAADAAGGREKTTRGPRTAP